MKKINLILICILSIFLFTSCDKFFHWYNGEYYYYLKKECSENITKSHYKDKKTSFPIPDSCLIERRKDTIICKKNDKIFFTIIIKENKQNFSKNSFIKKQVDIESKEFQEGDYLTYGNHRTENLRGKFLEKVVMEGECSWSKLDVYFLEKNMIYKFNFEGLALFYDDNLCTYLSVINQFKIIAN